MKNLKRSIANNFMCSLIVLFSYSAASAQTVSLKVGDSITVGNTIVSCGVAGSSSCSQIGAYVYCGYGCEQIGAYVYCGQTPGSSCSQIGAYVYCGQNCKQIGAYVYCGNGLAQPAQPAQPAKMQ